MQGPKTGAGVADVNHLSPISAADVERYVDQRTVLHGIGWDDFQARVAARGGCAGPRLACLDGELELTSPSEAHEGLKTTPRRMLEAWADLAGVEVEGRGSWTLLTTPGKKAGIEPDECYFVGERGRQKVPDLALEVVWPHGLLDELELYRRLGVGEVCLWEKGESRVLVLGRRGHEPRPKSAVLPRIDLHLLRRCLKEPTRTKALKRLRAALGTRRLNA